MQGHSDIRYCKKAFSRNDFVSRAKAGIIKQLNFERMVYYVTWKGFSS